MAKDRFFHHSTQLFQHQIPTEFILLGLIEFPILILALYLGLELRFMGHSWESSIGSFLPKATLYAFVMQICLIAMGVYQRQIGRFIDVLVLRIGSGLLLGLILLGVTYYVAPSFFLGRGVITLTAVISFFLISINRVLYQSIIDEHSMWPRVLVLGNGAKAKLIKEAMLTGGLHGVRIVDYIDMDKSGRHLDKFGGVILDEPLFEYAIENRVDEIVLALEERRTGVPSRDLLNCKMRGIDVLNMVSFFERRAGKIRLDLLYPSWLYLSEGFHKSAFRRLRKRMFDVAIVLLTLPVVLPLILLVAFIIYVHGWCKKPILYKQCRVGENGKEFQIYKFRSMDTDAEQDGIARWASKNDSRVTSVGLVLRKTRLDELPQLYNVLKGDMSFVGPRPERPEFVTHLADKIPYYEERLRVKPGLTGWAQIKYSYGSSEKDALEKLQYDLYYVKNFSILLDLLILLQTVEVVILGKGAR